MPQENHHCVMLEQIGENLSDMLFLLKGQTIIHANSAACDTLGYAQEELTGIPAGHIDPLLTPEYSQFLSEAMDTAGRFTYDTTLAAKNGRTLDVTVQARRCVHKKGASLMLFARDVTEQKKTLEALRENEKLFGSLIENLPGFAYILRMDSDGRFGFEFLSRGIEATYGIAYETAKNDFDASLEPIHAVDREKVTSGLEQSAKRLLPFRTEFRVAHPQKGEIWVEADALPERRDDGTVAWYGIITDATERIQSQNRAELITTAVNLAGEAVYISRPDQRGIHRFTFINDKAVDMLGYDKEELMGMTFWHIDPDLSEERFSDLSKEEEMIYEARHRCRDGNLIPVEVNLKLLRSTDGELGITMVRDISERKMQEALLRKREEEFRSLAENAQDPIYRYDRDCRRIYVNPAVERIGGKPASQLLGKTPDESMIIPPAENKKVMESIKKTIRTGKPDETELLFILPDGGRRYYRHNHIPEFGADGKVESVLAIGRDITAQKELRLREEMFRTLAENSPNIIMRYDPEGKRIYANPAFSRHTGIPLEKAQNARPDTQWDTHLDMKTMNASEYQERIRRVIDSGESANFTVEWYRLGDGGYIACDLHIVAERNADGEITGALAIGHDVTERKAIETELKQKEAKLNEAQKIAKVGSWELTFPGLELTWSDEVYRIFEIDPAVDTMEAYDHFLGLVHPDDRERLDTLYGESLKEKIPYDFEHRLLMPDGRIKHLNEKGETYYDDAGRPLRTIGTVQDITRQKNAEQKIEHMAHHDPLTALPNRVLAKDRTEQEIAHARRDGTKTALLFIDLDGFKAVNDTLGHHTGDALLKAVASRLRGCVREIDTVSRLGGDEFLVILSGLKEGDDISTVADKLLREFEEPFRIRDHLLSTSASLGIAVWPENGETYEMLLQSADTAMYKAKESGKNAFCFHSPQMQRELFRQFTIQNELKNALRDNEFILHYQPQVDLAADRITGAEALIRWDHPQKGMIPPGEFIPVAETSGLIAGIGEWVIGEACRQAAAWQKEGIYLTVAVNISSVQFKRGNLEQVVTEAIGRHGIDPKYLELELTESIIMHDTENTLQAVGNLKSIGVGLSIDDFGTGYSSLAYLKRFAVDKLKIDQSFIRDILTDRDDAVIVRTIVQMAKNLGLKTIAEGVEDEAVLDLVRDYACDEVQGYHFARPMKADDFKHYYLRRANGVMRAGPVAAETSERLPQ